MPGGFGGEEAGPGRSGSGRKKGRGYALAQKDAVQAPASCLHGAAHRQPGRVVQAIGGGVPETESNL